MTILVSACLLGLPCRYDGKAKQYPAVLRLAEKHTLIPVCPEQLGGLQTPRVPSERQGERVMNKEGADNTTAFLRGAQCALDIARLTKCEIAVLRAKSPSCGCGKIYDGTFSGTLTDGNGVTAELLQKNGIQVLSDDDPRIKDL